MSKLGFKLGDRGGYIMDGDTSTVDVHGITLTARVVGDEHTTIDDYDTWNPDQSVTGCNDEQQVELLRVREAYFRGEWDHVGIVVSIDAPAHLANEHAASLWGIEANVPLEGASFAEQAKYLDEAAEELGQEALESVGWVRIGVDAA